MIKLMHSFILKIQNSDEPTKKFWLVVLSGATMVAVVALWLVYMNVTLPTASPAPTSVAAAIDKPAVQTPGFFAIFTAGLKIIYDKVQEVVANQVATKNTIVIENQERNFVLEGLPAVAPVKLGK